MAICTSREVIARSNQCMPWRLYPVAKNEISMRIAIAIFVLRCVNFVVLHPCEDLGKIEGQWFAVGELIYWKLLT